VKWANTSAGVPDSTRLTVNPVAVSPSSSAFMNGSSQADEMILTMITHGARR
jgi:hypothetical protein